MELLNALLFNYNTGLFSYFWSGEKIYDNYTDVLTQFLSRHIPSVYTLTKFSIL